MKMHKIELYVLDFEDFGIDDVITTINDSSHYYMFHALSPQTTDIGEWDDDHELNHLNVTPEQCNKYFSK